MGRMADKGRQMAMILCQEEMDGWMDGWLD